MLIDSASILINNLPHCWSFPLHVITAPAPSKPFFLYQKRGGTSFYYFHPMLFSVPFGLSANTWKSLSWIFLKIHIVYMVM